MTEDIIGFVRELVDAWNTHDLERALAFYSPGYEGVDVGQASPQRGLEGVRQTMARYWSAFPDLHFTGDETIIEGNRIALAWTARGTHQGTLMNIPATGRSILVPGVSLLTIEGGKITRGLYIWDVAGLLRAIGLLPDL